jgi:hypothetical protein
MTSFIPDCSQLLIKDTRICSLDFWTQLQIHREDFTNKVIGFILLSFHFIWSANQTLTSIRWCNTYTAFKSLVHYLVAACASLELASMKGVPKSFNVCTTVSRPSSGIRSPVSGMQVTHSYDKKLQASHQSLMDSPKNTTKWDDTDLLCYVSSSSMQDRLSGTYEHRAMFLGAVETM